MKYCGLLFVKTDSKRLKDKNYLKLGDKAMWEYPFLSIVEAGLPCFTYHQGINRPDNASQSEEPIFQCIKWAYKSLFESFDAVVCILANCPMITSNDVKRAIKTYEQLGVKELRSFDKHGKESGLLILDTQYVLDKHEISTYQGSIHIESIEIHTKSDYEKCKQLMRCQ